MSFFHSLLSSSRGGYSELALTTPDGRGITTPNLEQITTA